MQAFTMKFYQHRQTSFRKRLMFIVII